MQQQQQSQVKVQRPAIIEEVVDTNFQQKSLIPTDKEWSSICSITQILPYVYIGGWETALSETDLKTYNIKFILQAMDSDVKKLPNIMKMYDQLGIVHVKINLPNLHKEPLKPHLDGVFTLISKAVSLKKNILLHCQQGVSTTPALVAYYTLKIFYNKTRPGKPMIDSIIEKMKEKRPCIDINVGFTKQLKDIEQELRVAP